MIVRKINNMPWRWMAVFLNVATCFYILSTMPPLPTFIFHPYFLLFGQQFEAILLFYEGLAQDIGWYALAVSGPLAVAGIAGEIVLWHSREGELSSWLRRATDIIQYANVPSAAAYAVGAVPPLAIFLLNGLIWLLMPIAAILLLLVVVWIIRLLRSYLLRQAVRPTIFSPLDALLRWVKN